MKNILSVDQCRAMMPAMKSTDYALFVSLLLCGSDARTWSWERALRNVLDLPQAVYQALRDLATSQELALVQFNSAHFAQFESAHWMRSVSSSVPIFKASLPRNSKTTTSPQRNNALKGQALTTQDVTRRMKRYARLAGLNESQVNLRAVLNTHNWLLRNYGSADKAAEALGLTTRRPATRSRKDAKEVSWMPLSTVRAIHPVRDPRLHGIGRRS